MISAISPPNAGFTLLLLGLGTAGGGLAALAGAPMPFMLGSLAVSAGVSGVFGQRFPPGYAFPAALRLLFIGLIGVMIGAQVDPEMFERARGFALSIAAVSLFVVLAQLMNYHIFRRIGGHDRVTAWFSGSPGGLIEAVTMGEAAGGDVRVLTLLQFLRIILVVSVLPVALSLWHGAPVGSAAGLSLAGAGQGLAALVSALAWALALVLGGLVAGRVLRLPAGQLTGPLLVAAIASWLGWLDLSLPGWVLASAQVVLGVNLGVRFHGVGRALLVRCAGLSLISVTAMLALGAVLALAVHRVTGLSFEVLLISYAPGGVSEMGLVAISLSANSTIVVMHHLYRITLTVLILSMARRFGVLRR